VEEEETQTSSRAEPVKCSKAGYVSGPLLEGTMDTSQVQRLRFEMVHYIKHFVFRAESVNFYIDRTL
jgi:hypothetical protein